MNPTITAPWRKSSYSNSQGNCVEFAPTADGGVALRNSRFPDSGALVFTKPEIAAMVAGVKNGEMDDLI